MPASRLKVRAVGPRFRRKPRYVQQYGGSILDDIAKPFNGVVKTGRNVYKHCGPKGAARMAYSRGLKYA